MGGLCYLHHFRLTDDGDFFCPFGSKQAEKEGEKMLYVALLVVLILFFLALLFLIYCCLVAGQMLEDEMQDYGYNKENRKVSDRYW